jgi:hypothetical protein
MSLSLRLLKLPSGKTKLNQRTANKFARKESVFSKLCLNDKLEESKTGRSCATRVGVGRNA